MFEIALKSVRRNKRRSIITFILIFMVTMIVSFMRYLGFGMHQDMIWQVVGLRSGYIQVAANGWLEDRNLERALDVPPKLLNKIKHPAIQEISPRLEGFGLVSHTGSARFISILAANAHKEKSITSLHTKIRQGKLPDENFRIEDGRPIYPAVLGARLARDLDVKIGSKIYILTSQFDGSTGGIIAEISGIYKSGDLQLDRNQVIVGLGAGQEIFAPDDPETGIPRFTSLAIGVRDYRQAEKVYTELKKKFPVSELEEGVPRSDSDNYDPLVHNWEELNPGIVQYTDLDQYGNELWLGMMILIVAFGVMNNIQMSIQNRIREFGILLAIGTSPGQLMWMVTLEFLMVFLPALIAGMLAGAGFGYWIEVSPIVLTGAIGEAYAEFGVVPRILAIVDPGETIIAILSMLIPSTLLAGLAMRKILRLEPARIINTI